MFVLALLSAAVAFDVPVARDTLDHRGTRYEVAHRPAVRTRIKTVGMAAGTRPSTERCRWTATVRVERTIARAGSGDAVLSSWLPDDAQVTGYRNGACPREMADVAAEPQVRDTAARLVARAGADRASVLAAIDAAAVVAAR